MTMTVSMQMTAGRRPADEMARDEARHGKAFKGLLDRCYK